MKALLRTAFIVSTVLAVCFALVQVGCRIAFWQSPRLEAAINGALADQGIALRGLEGRWNGINPGIYADRITFPAGEAVGVDVEIDVLESLGRNRVVAPPPDDRRQPHRLRQDACGLAAAGRIRSERLRPSSLRHS